MRFRGNIRRHALVAGLALAALAAVLPPTGPAAAAGSGAAWRATELYPIARGLDSGARTLKPGAFYGLSCPSPGNCEGAGWYQQRTHSDPFVDSRPMTGTESDGTWALARRLWLPSTTLDPTAGAQVTSVSCPARDWCAAGGLIPATGNREYAFVITESGGQWNRPHLVPIPADAQASPAISEIDGISCPRPRSCTAVGWYITRAPDSYVPIVVTESAGHWGRVTRLPVHLRPGPDHAELTSVTCPTPRWCAAVGTDTFGPASQFTASLVTVFAGGRWRTPAVPPGGRDDSLTSVGCRSAGDCVAVGSGTYTTYQNGRWSGVGGISVVPPDGTPISIGPDIDEVSCTPAACLAGGRYFSNTRKVFPPFVVSYSGGAWPDPVAIRLPKNGGPDSAGTVTAVSCTTSCTAVGTYSTRNGRLPMWAATGPG